jgi:hypothetical protein
VTQTNNLEKEINLVRNFSIDYFNGVAHCPISMITQISKDCLRALPIISETEEIHKENLEKYQNMYLVEIKVNDVLLGKGYSSSKKKAKTIAAKSALKHLVPDIYS